MEKIAFSFMLIACSLLAAIQIRGIIKGRFPLFGFSKKLLVPLDTIEKKLATSAGVLFFFGLIILFASF